MMLNEMIRARDSLAAVLAALDPKSPLFAAHYDTWATFDRAVNKMLAEGAA